MPHSPGDPNLPTWADWTDWRSDWPDWEILAWHPSGCAKLECYHRLILQVTVQVEQSDKLGDVSTLANLTTTK
mgnify:CR=1 FL=1